MTGTNDSQTPPLPDAEAALTLVAETQSVRRIMRFVVDGHPVIVPPGREPLTAHEVSVVVEHCDNEPWTWGGGVAHGVTATGARARGVAMWPHDRAWLPAWYTRFADLAVAAANTDTSTAPDAAPNG